MTFFENEARTRRATGLLVTLFVLGVAGVVGALNLVAALVYVLVTGSFTRPAPTIPRELFVWTTVITISVIAVRSLIGIHAMRAGGNAVAALCGSAPLDRGTHDPAEKRLLNIVDEMALASGVAVPHVYVMRGEYGINAFAAGYAANQSAIGVTAGALKSLNRDEMQGVIAHEFSHVLNGDARLNVDLVGILDGLLFVGGLGTFMIRAATDSDDDETRDASKYFARNMVFLVAGLAITIVGWVGLFFGRLIKAAVARQREYLADASSVQFTRNPDGLAGALALIGASEGSSLIFNRHAEAMSHMFFANGVAALTLEFLFPTHPPVAERITRIDPGFQAERYLATRRPGESASTPASPEPSAPPRPPVAAVVPPAVAAGLSPPVAAVMTSIGNPAPEHVDYAARLVSTIPPALHEAIATPGGAQAVILAFALSDDESTRAEQLGIVQRAGGETLATQAAAMGAQERALARSARLPVVSLALPSLRRLDQPAQASFVTVLRAVIDADRRVTLEEFVLLTIVSQQLRADAGRAVAVKYRSLMEIPEQASLVLSLLAHAGAGEDGDARPAFEKAAGALRLSGRLRLIPMKDIAFTRVTRSLDELRLLAPFVKREFVRACVEAVEAHNAIGVAEAEVLRAVAAAVDCPVPPVLNASVSD